MDSLQRNSRDEDLALFHDMRRRERRNFLFPLKDDIEASPRRDDVFSTFCLSASTHTQIDHNLLPLDSEKNDYDWLLTPPSTPLFPSLDQDVRIVNLSQRRILTRSTSVSKAARLSYPQEPSPVIIHGGNPGPRHPSTALSTDSSISTNRGRPLSPSLTHRSSFSVRSSSPCRLTTSTGRNVVAASRPASRSLTPTLRRNNTSPSPANRVGPTNGKSRGKSLSPKLGPWEPSLPGFSAEPPPNLRTSLSDRTIQRGLSQAPRNGVRNKSSFAEASGSSRRSLGSADSFDGDGNWSLSYGNDRNSSQTSRASVVSSCDDDMDMAESVVSGNRKPSFDSGVKPAYAVVAKLEDPSNQKYVLPSKRQLKPAGTFGDAVPVLSASARRSYERQVAQRRSAQTMFRPLLSSAPITSFYSTRSDSIHACSSSPFLESSATQNGRLHSCRDEGLNGVRKTGVADSHVKSENATADSACGLEIIEKEAESNSHFDEKGLELIEKQVLGTVRDVGAPEEENQPVQPLHLEGDAMQVSKQVENRTCDMDVDVTGPNISSALERSKVKELQLEDHKLTNSAKPHAYLGAIGSISSQHGGQRVLSDLGSFRRRSPMKTLNTRSHDGSLITEKAVSCDSFNSDSHSLLKGLASALSNIDPTETPLKCQVDSMEADVCCESTCVWSKKLHSNIEGDACLHSYPISTDTGDDTLYCTFDPDSCSKGAHLSQYSLVNQLGLPDDGCQVNGVINSNSEEFIPEVFSGKAGEPLMSDVNDKLTPQDVLSFLGSCTPSTAMLEDGSELDDCLEASHTTQSRRFSDALSTTSRHAADAPEQGELTQGQIPDVSLLKRNLTLEEATDTILFCSSIIHELAYKSATLAIEAEEQRVSKPLVSKREFATLFGFSGADHKTYGGKMIRRRDSAVSKSSLVQKQRMVHRRTPAVTMRQSPMDRIENAVIGNHEEIQEPIVSKLQKRKVQQGKKVQCRCNCCMM